MKAVFVGSALFLARQRDLVGYVNQPALDVLPKFIGLAIPRNLQPKPAPDLLIYRLLAGSCRRTETQQADALSLRLPFG